MPLHISGLLEVFSVYMCSWLPFSCFSMYPLLCALSDHLFAAMAELLDNAVDEVIAQIPFTIIILISLFLPLQCSSVPFHLMILFYILVVGNRQSKLIRESPLCSLFSLHSVLIASILAFEFQ